MTANVQLKKKHLGHIERISSLIHMTSIAVEFEENLI